MSMADTDKPVPRVAAVSWAQRTDRIYLTVEVTDCSKPRITLEKDGTFLFTGIAGRDRHPYELRLELYGLVEPDESKIAVNPRYLFIVVAKQTTGPHWPRLLKAEGRPPKNVKVDWDKWKDEDEEDAERNHKEFNVGDLDDMHKFDEYADEEMDSEGENDEEGTV